jgi:hypothetical protein
VIVGPFVPLRDGLTLAVLLVGVPFAAGLAGGVVAELLLRSIPGG